MACIAIQPVQSALRVLLVAGALWSSAALPPPAAAEPVNSSAVEQQRALLRRLSQQQQQRLEQHLRCIDAAASTVDLDRCARSFAPAWHHGMGRGEWGCQPW